MAVELALEGWLPNNFQTAGGGLSCVGLGEDGSTYLASNLLDPAAPAQQPDHTDFSPPLWDWDTDGVRGTAARMEQLCVHALLVQLYQPELLSTCLAAKVRSGTAPLAGLTGAAATGTLCCMARSVRAGGCSGSSRCMWGSLLPIGADRSLRWGESGLGSLERPCHPPPGNHQRRLRPCNCT